MEESDVTVLQIWDLPLDLLERILTLSKPKAIARLQLSCRDLHKAVQDCELHRGLWRSKLARDYNVLTPLPGLFGGTCGYKQTYRLLHTQTLTISGVGMGLVTPIGASLFANENSLHPHRNWLPRWVSDAPPLRYRTPNCHCDDAALEASYLLRCLKCMRKELKSSDYLVRGLRQLCVANEGWSFLIQCAAVTMDGRLLAWTHGHPQMIPPGPLYLPPLSPEERLSRTTGRFAAPNTVQHVTISRDGLLVVSTDGDLWRERQDCGPFGKSVGQCGEDMEWERVRTGDWTAPARFKKTAAMTPVAKCSVFASLEFLLLEDGSVWVRGWGDVGARITNMSETALASMYGLGGLNAVYDANWEDRRTARARGEEPAGIFEGDPGDEGGELMEGDQVYLQVPRRVRGDLEGRRVVDVSAGDTHVACVLEGGEVVTWGHNDRLQTGHVLSSSTAPKMQPQIVADLAGHHVVKVQCGYRHTVALTRTGLVFVWGSAEYGATGELQLQSPHPSLRHPCLRPQLLHIDPRHGVGPRAVDIAAGNMLTVVIDVHGRAIVFGGVAHDRGPRVIPLAERDRVPLTVACGGLPEGTSSATDWKTLDALLILSVPTSAFSGDGGGREPASKGAAAGEATAAAAAAAGVTSLTLVDESVPPLSPGNAPAEKEPVFPSVSRVWSGLELSVPAARRLERSCALCGGFPEGRGTLKCGRCKAAFYCCADHQKLHWPAHKANCKAPDPATATAP